MEGQTLPFVPYMFLVTCVGARSSGNSAAELQLMQRVMGLAPGKLCMGKATGLQKLLRVEEEG